MALVTQYIVQTEYKAGRIDEDRWVWLDSRYAHGTAEDAEAELRAIDLTRSHFFSGRARIIRRDTTITETIVKEH